MKLSTLTPFRPFRALRSWWHNRRAAREAAAHGTAGAALREAVRNLQEDELAQARQAFAAQFATYSNRQRARWLAENQIAVAPLPGRTVRQCQQIAAVQWFDRTHAGRA